MMMDRAIKIKLISFSYKFAQINVKCHNFSRISAPLRLASFFHLSISLSRCFGVFVWVQLFLARMQPIIEIEKDRMNLKIIIYSHDIRFMFVAQKNRSNGPLSSSIVIQILSRYRQKKGHFNRSGRRLW